MQRKRQQEAAIQKAVDDAQQDLREHQRLRQQQQRTFTPVEKAQYTRREPPSEVPQPEDARVVQCALAGLPSAGKSSLLCALVGTKISASSGKINTTIRPVLGVLTQRNTQILLTDTPGIDAVRTSSADGEFRIKEMATGAMDALQDNLVTVYVHDVRRGLDHQASRLLSKMVEIRHENPERRLFVALTHVDVVKGSAQEYMTRSAIKAKFPKGVDAIFAIDALRARLPGFRELVAALVDRAVPGKWLYPETYKTNRSDVELVDDIVREKLFRRFNHEMPYQITNATVGWTESKNKMLVIDHALYVKRPTHARLVQQALKFIHERSLRDIQGILRRDCLLRFQVIDESSSPVDSSGTNSSVNRIAE